MSWSSGEFLDDDVVLVVGMLRFNVQLIKSSDIPAANKLPLVLALALAVAAERI